MFIDLKYGTLVLNSHNAVRSKSSAFPQTRKIWFLLHPFGETNFYFAAGFYKTRD